MKRKCALVSSLVLLSSSSGWADSAVDVDLSLRESQVSTSSETKTQGRIRVGFVIDARGVVEIVGVMDSGNYNTTWTTLATDRPFRDQPALAFKNIYLRKTVGIAKLEAGALPGEYEVGSAGTQSSGWTDAAQVTLKTEFGDLRVIAGSLGHFDQGNFFDRKFAPNFLEVELTHEMFDMLTAKTAIQSYKNDVFVKERLEFAFKTLGDNVIKLVANALFDVQHEAMNFEFGAELDVLKTIFNRFDHRLDMRIYFVQEDARLAERAKMIPLFLCYGPQGVVYLSGKIDPKGNVNWFVRAAAGVSSSTGIQERVDAGLNFKLPQITSNGRATF